MNDGVILMSLLQVNLTRKRFVSAVLGSFRATPAEGSLKQVKLKYLDRIMILYIAILKQVNVKYRDSIMRLYPAILKQVELVRYIF